MKKIAKKTIWGLGIADGMVTMISEVYLGGAVTYFYLRNLGLNPKYEVVAWMIFAIWNAIDDLIAGSITDRKMTKLGRRIPYIRFFGPIMGIMFALTFLPSSTYMQQWALEIAFLLNLFLLDFAISFLEAVIFAVPFESTLSNQERGKTLLWEAIFDVMSLIVPMVIIPMLQPDVGEDTFLFRIVMIGIGFISGFLVFIASHMIEQETEIDLANLHSMSTISMVVGCLKNKPFLISQIGNVIYMSVYTIFMFGMYYYFDEICEYEIPCYIAAIIGVALCLFVYKFVLDKVGVKMVLACSMIAGGILFLVAFFCGRTVMAGIFSFLSFGYSYISYMMFYYIQVGDTMDYDEYKNHVRREGTYMGYDCLFSSLSNGAQSAFVLIIGAFGYVHGQATGTQTITAQNGIMLGWLVGPGILLLIGGLCIAFLYPLNQSEMYKIKAELELRQQEKETLK